MTDDSSSGSPGLDPELIPDVEASSPLPNRFSRGTLVGCIGIACVLALPALLFLPLDDWHIPGWLSALVPLVGLGAVALGAWLLLRVPPGHMPARNAFRPLTGAGLPPLVEQPATASNRIGAIATGALVLLALGAVLVIAGGAFQHHALVPALLVAGLVGVALVGYGVMVGSGRLPPPAMHWVRRPVRGQVRVAAPLVLAGLTAIIWVLLVAADAGYRWADVGLGLLVVAGVLAAPLARRSPRDER